MGELALVISCQTVFSKSQSAHKAGTLDFIFWKILLKWTGPHHFTLKKFTFSCGVKHFDFHKNLEQSLTWFDIYCFKSCVLLRELKFKLKTNIFSVQLGQMSVLSNSKEVFALVYIAFAFIQLEVPITEKLTDFPRAP